MVETKTAPIDIKPDLKALESKPIETPITKPKYVRPSRRKKDIPLSVDIEIPISTLPPEKKPRVNHHKKVTPDKTVIGEKEINSLVCGMFSLISMKGGPHWIVSQQEASSVSKPLSNILDKMDMSEQVAKFSDGLMLIVAAVTLTMPRVLISQNNKKNSNNRNAKIKNELEDKRNVKSAGSNNPIRQPDYAGGNNGPTITRQLDKAISYASPQ